MIDALRNNFKLFLGVVLIRWPTDVCHAIGDKRKGMQVLILTNETFTNRNTADQSRTEGSAMPRTQRFKGTKKGRNTIKFLGITIKNYLFH